jgi:hypothetical protein
MAGLFFREGGGRSDVLKRVLGQRFPVVSMSGVARMVRA